MNQSASAMKCGWTTNRLSGKLPRLAIGTMLLTGLVACASAPFDPAESETGLKQAPQPGLSSVSAMYNSGDYAGSIAGFDDVIASADSNANSRRMAHLGKALIYLGSDKNWYSIDNAKMSLKAAGSVVPGDSEEFAIETDMLMDSIAAQIETESEYQELQAKTSDSMAEIKRLQKERDALVQEREELLDEQLGLKEALEKLKNLTLGS